MRFALLTLVGILFVASDASAGRFRVRAQQQNSCPQQFRAPAVAFVAPQHNAAPVLKFVAPVQQQNNHHNRQQVALPVVDAHGDVIGFQKFSR